ncbi:hypothetical protein [Aurantimonas coralicida]|uniref:hypothetical protein n=1 Tax=Aurantimonas coralicida TaxID=182270 RepID=UPI00355984B0
MSAKPVSSLQAVSALGILIVFALFAGYVVYVASSGATDGVWSRILVIFSSFEALGFAAAGLLLGQQINATTARRVSELETKNDGLAADLTKAELQNSKLVGATLPTLRTVRKQLEMQHAADGKSTEFAELQVQVQRDTVLQLLDEVIAETDAAQHRR